MVGDASARAPSSSRYRVQGTGYRVGVGARAFIISRICSADLGAPSSSCEVRREA